MEMTKPETIVIAHLSYLKAGAWVAICSAPIGLAFWTAWNDGDGWAYFAGGVAAMIVGPVLYMLLFRRARGLWIRNGELIYLAKWIVWMRVDEIMEVGIGRRGGLRRALVVRTSDRGPISIPAAILAEPLDVVQDRLRDAAGLKTL
jgi:hypothetical protein